MPRWQRVYVVVCCALIGYAIAYSLSEYAQWPRLVIAPVTGEARLDRPPIARTEVGYVGLLLWGLGGSLVGGVAAAAATSMVHRPLGDRSLRLLGGWALTAVALAGAFYTWSLWPF
jgi:hypothetical protein